MMARYARVLVGGVLFGLGLGLGFFLYVEIVPGLSGVWFAFPLCLIGLGIVVVGRDGRGEFAKQLRAEWGAFFRHH